MAVDNEEVHLDSLVAVRADETAGLVSVRWRILLVRVVALAPADGIVTQSFKLHTSPRCIVKEQYV